MISILIWLENKKLLCQISSWKRFLALSLSLSLSASWDFFTSLSLSRFISYTLSQTKFVAIMLILLVFFLAYSLHQFFFRPICLFVLRNRIKRQLPVSIKFSQSPFSPFVSKCANNRNCFGDLYLRCEGCLLEIDPHPHTTPNISPPPIPTPAHLSGCKVPVLEKITIPPLPHPPPLPPPRCVYLTPLQLS